MDFNDTKEEAKFRKKCRGRLVKNATYKDESTPQNDDFANADKMKVAKAWQKRNMMLDGLCYIGRKSLEA